MAEQKHNLLTIGELARQTNTPYYVCQYLDRLGKLPKEKKSSGHGRPSIFSESAIEVVLNHVNRKSDGR